MTRPRSDFYAIGVGQVLAPQEGAPRLLGQP